MRFVVTGEWSKNQLLRLIMVMFLGFVACFWLVTTLLFVEKMGFSAAGVAQYFWAIRSSIWATGAQLRFHA